MNNSAKITHRRVRQILECYGANPMHWPADERAAVARCLAQDPELAGLLESEHRLDDRLDRSLPALEPASNALLARVMASHARTAVQPPMPSPVRSGAFEWLSLLGGPRVICPVLASAFAVGVALGQYSPQAGNRLDSASSPASTVELDLLTLAQFVTVQPENLE